MRLNKKIIFTILVVIIVFLLYLFFLQFFLVNQEAKIAGQVDAKYFDLPIIKTNEMFFDRDNFLESIQKVEKAESLDSAQIIVVPHHLLASSITAELIKKASGREIETVFIVGPNHFNIGTDVISTVKARWETNNGYLEIDEEKVDQLIHNLNLKSNFEAFEKEHSIGAVAPFVKYFLPKAKIVPIIYNSYSRRGDVEFVSEWLAENMDKKSLIIASIDFSHYLKKELADERDVVTKKLIEDRDVDMILTLNNDYVDSPASLSTALMIAQKKELETQIIHNSNSWDFLINKPVETTSYFGIVFID